MRSVRMQLIAVFLAVILLPCGAITYLMYTQSIELIERNRGDAQVSKLSKTASLIDQALSDMSLLLNQLAANGSFLSAAARIQPGPDDPNARRASNIMRNTQSFYNSRIDTLYLYLYQTCQIVTGYANQRVVEVKEEAYYDWLAKYPLDQPDSAESTPWFLSRGVPSVSVTEPTGRVLIKKRLLKGREGNSLGELGMIISAMTLRSAFLDPVRDSDDEILLVLDQELNPITSIGMDVAKFRALSDQPFIGQLSGASAQGQFRSAAFGTSMQVCYARSRQSGFIYVSMFPVGEFTRGMAEAGMKGVFVALLASVMAVFGSIWYSMRLSGPIRMLREAMQRVGSGDLSVRADYARRDEFSEMTDGFNSMIRRIEQLMHDLQGEELLLKEAELRNLQAQVNPHFLYNALETIHWMARTDHTQEVADLSIALANFYRATLSQGRKTVSVGESFEMIREYIKILTARYGERFSVAYAEPEDLKGAQVLHLVLQPLVENAIQHSIERVPYHVNLFIGIEAVGDDLVMTVHDDGAGIDEEMLSRVRASLDDESTRPEGFAIKNVHRRIRLLYGEGYGLTIESQPGGYTTVRARMRRLDGEVKGDVQSVDRGR